MLVDWLRNFFMNVMCGFRNIGFYTAGRVFGRLSEQINNMHGGDARQPSSRCMTIKPLCGDGDSCISKRVPHLAQALRDGFDVNMVGTGSDQGFPCSL